MCQTFAEYYELEVYVLSEEHSYYQNRIVDRRTEHRARNDVAQVKYQNNLFLAGIVC